MNFWETVKAAAADFAQNTGLAIVRTIAFLVLGLVIIRVVQTIARSATLKSNRLDRSASTFVLSILTVVMYIALIIVLVSSLGFSTAGIIAAFSAVALAVALALKDSLGSLANGVIIIFTKPFKKGDYVEINGFSGLVQDIRLFNTKILTYSNEAIIIPNSQVLGAELINYSAMPIRRVVFEFQTPYNTDAEMIKRAVLQSITGIADVVTTPAPSVVLSDYKESSLIFSARTWTTNEHYWDVYFAMRDEILKTLRENGIEIPYNRLEVTLRENAEIQYGGKRQ